jgi:acetyl-CoA acetyltransferase
MSAMTPVIAGVGMTSFGRFPDRSIKDLGREAVEDALADAGLSLGDIQAVFFSNALAGIMTGQECIRGEVMTYHLGLDSVPVINVENACASGGTAMHLAYRSIATGEWDCVLALGIEKMYDQQDRSRPVRALYGALDVDEIEGELRTDRSPFMDVYANRARRLMDTQGVTALGMAKVAAKAWSNGSHNPKAQRTRPMTAEEVLDTKLVVDPLTVAMCSLIGDGAAAAVITSRRQQAPRDIPIRSSQLRTLSHNGEAAAALASRAAYEQAGIEASQISVAEVHDATAIGEMISWVDLGLCPPGHEEAWAQDGHTELHGPLPVNPSGGLLARGHPLGASGIGQCYELALQLRNEAGERQVTDPEFALAHVGGGVIKGKTAVAAVHVLERPAGN